GFDARAERGYEIADRRFVGDADVLGGRRRGLAPEKLEQLLAVDVGVLFRDPLRGHRGNELASGLDLTVRHREVREARGQLGWAPNLIGEEERLEGERVFQRTDGDDVWLRPEDEPADPDHARALH